MQGNLRKREDIQLSIIALLLAHKKGCTLQRLNNDYYEVEGECIPWKDLGYHSLPSLLNSMPNVEMQRENNVTIVKGIASEKSKHVTRLINQQKSASQMCQRKRYKPSCYYPKTAPPRIHIPAEILSSVISLVNKYPNGLDKKYVFEEIQMLMPSLHINKNDLEAQLNELSHKIVQRKGKIYPVKTETYESGNCKGFDGASSTEFVSKEQKSPIVIVAGSEDSDDTLNCSQEDDFEPLNCSYQLEFSNLNRKIQSPSSFVEETVSESQNQMLEKTLRTQMEQKASTNILEVEFHTNAKEDNGHCLGNKNMEMLINDRIKFRLKKLIENHPDGIWCADLPEKYLEEYKVPLNYVELGFNSVREFASQLPEIFNCIQPYNTGDYKLYDVYNEIPLKKIEGEQEAINLPAHDHENTTEEEEEALPSVVSLDTCKGLIPDEVMSIGECVGYLNVAALMESKQQEPYVEVVVVEVFTPTFFWIQYRKKQRMFKTFMDDLHNFYLSNYQQYAIPPIVLERGLNCACVYNGIWHRGIIKTVKPDMQVVVMFYDYGTLKTYAAKAVYYLHKVFAYLPAQAIPCALINVRPNEGCKWSTSATHNFALRTSQIPLVATVASINVEDNSMMISLTDTLGEEDVHINDWLVEQKLAKYGKMVCMKKRNFPFHASIECQKYVTQKYIKSNTDENEMNSRNEAALYNLRLSLQSFHLNNSNATRHTKSFECNTSGRALQSVPSNNSGETNFSVEEINNFAHNCGDKFRRRILPSYENSMEFSFEQKSTCPDKMNDDDNDNNQAQANIEHRNDKLLDASLTIKGLTEKKSDADLISYEIECIDWSTIWKNAINGKPSVSDKIEPEIPTGISFKNRKDIPLAENYFLRAVYSSSCNDECEDRIRWSPSGNISQMHDVPQYILKDIEKRRNSMSSNMTIAIPQKVLEILTGEKYSDEILNISKNINEIPCTNSLEKVDIVRSDNLEFINGSETLPIESFEQHSENNIKNYYLHMKPLTSKRILLEKVLSTADTLSCTSSPDSDDFSTLEETIFDTCNMEGSYYESKIEPYKDTFETDTTCVSDLTKLETIDLCSQESLKGVEVSVLVQNEVPVKNPLVDLIPTNEVEKFIRSVEDVNISKDAVLIEEKSLNVEVNNSIGVPIQKSLSIEDAVHAEKSSTKELISCETVTEKSYMPMFDDKDIESDGEEWDASVSQADYCDLIMRFNENPMLRNFFIPGSS